MCKKNNIFSFPQSAIRILFQLIDLKTGQVTKTLIGQVAEGVNDVQARFTATGEHILYYHNGLQTLRAYRVNDGQLIGTLRPHSRVTTWTSDNSGQEIVMGGLDGSLLTTFLYDEKIYPDSQKSLAHLPSRRYLADHLNIVVDDPASNDNTEFRNLTVLTKAVQKFKSLINKDQQSSQVCSIQ
uniref:Bulb-type lectin domain-containing protein n=1 Tax=Bursaphelenchus xylophilus TaxID=6326 RepID=A0A1I7RSF6_BURXY